MSGAPGIAVEPSNSIYARIDTGKMARMIERIGWAIESAEEHGLEEDYYLHLPRSFWEKHPGHNWSEKALDKAEKHPQGFLGVSRFVICYLTREV